MSWQLTLGENKTPFGKKKLQVQGGKQTKHWESNSAGGSAGISCALEAFASTG